MAGDDAALDQLERRRALEQRRRVDLTFQTAIRSDEDVELLRRTLEHQRQFESDQRLYRERMESARRSLYGWAIGVAGFLACMLVLYVLDLWAGGGGVEGFRAFVERH